MTSSWTGPVILTLCLSLLALLVSITAFVWQVISLRISGARVPRSTFWTGTSTQPLRCDRTP